ncbi:MULTISPECIES: hypothetical protein [Streptomyces]|nr:hypothetical protein [Streptomyces luteoverticillatus]
MGRLRNKLGFSFNLALLEVGMGQAVLESITYSAVCQDCGARLECCGVQALVDGSLRWDVEVTCSVCGFAMAVCDDVLPSDLRDQLLSEHGAAWLRVTSPWGKSIAIIRVLRAELGLDLTEAMTALDRVLAEEFSGTLPEMEFLARKLRSVGVSAVAARP